MKPLAMNRFSLPWAPIALSLGLLVAAAPAQAQEVWGGLFAHAVDTPLTFETDEGGADVQVGVRASPIEALHAIGSPSPYAIASINTRGDTSFVGAGLSWTIGKHRLYLRPGIGLIVHDGPRERINANRLHTELGSRVLFEPELGLGYRVTRSLAVEANWTHISHAQLFNARQNPGIDMWGVRVNVRFE